MKTAQGRLFIEIIKLDIDDGMKMTLHTILESKKINLKPYLIEQKSSIEYGFFYVHRSGGYAINFSGDTQYKSVKPTPFATIS